MAPTPPAVDPRWSPTPTSARYRLMAARAQDREADLWISAGIASGARVADVGCGPGAVLALLARIVGPVGHVVGVGADEVAVQTATAVL